jgi:hypothetical protein
VAVQVRQVRQEPQEVLAVKVAMVIYGQSQGNIMQAVEVGAFIMDQAALAVQVVAAMQDLHYPHKPVAQDGQIMEAAVEVVLVAGVVLHQADLVLF